MSSVRIEQKSYEMPPRDGFTVTHFITVADSDRSCRRTSRRLSSEELRALEVALKKVGKRADALMEQS